MNKMKIEILARRSTQGIWSRFFELQNTIRTLHLSVFANKAIEEFLKISKDVYNHVFNPKMPAINDLNFQMLIQFNKSFREAEWDKEIVWGEEETFFLKRRKDMAFQVSKSTSSSSDSKKLKVSSSKDYKSCSYSKR